jgi:predicted DCC family thiol-disulfide oxidoreductase YuxK
MAAPRPTLIYDGDCAFCTSSVRFLEEHLPTGAEIRPWQFTELTEYGVTRERAEHEILWVTPTGQVYGGADAFAKLLLYKGGPWSVVGGALRVAPVSWAAHGVYRLVADNRDRMPGGTAACALPAHLRPGAVTHPA